MPSSVLVQLGRTELALLSIYTTDPNLSDPEQYTKLGMLTKDQFIAKLSPSSARQDCVGHMINVYDGPYTVDPE